MGGGSARASFASEMDPHLEQPHTGAARGGRGRGQTGHP